MKRIRDTYTSCTRQKRVMLYSEQNKCHVSGCNLHASVVSNNNKNFITATEEIVTCFYLCKDTSASVEETVTTLQKFLVDYESYITHETVWRLMRDCVATVAPFVIQKVLINHLYNVALSGINRYQFVKARAIGGTNCSRKILHPYINNKRLVVLLDIIFINTDKDCNNIFSILQGVSIIDRVFDNLNGFFKEFGLYDDPFKIDVLKLCVKKYAINKWNRSIDFFLNQTGDERFAFLVPLLISPNAN